MAVERQLALDQVEDVIRQLRDVISARVVFGPENQLAEIHVLTQSTRSPKQVVRDIESALMAHLGVEVDHKKISVAQVAGPVRADQPRLKIADVSVVLNGCRAEAKVRLIKDGVVYEGLADGHNSAVGQLKQVATATLRCIEESRGIEGSLVLEDLNTGTQLAGRPVVLIGVNWVSDRGEELLVGSAVVKQDFWKAVVNATLDAVNRRLSVKSSEG